MAVNLVTKRLPAAGAIRLAMAKVILRIWVWLLLRLILPRINHWWHNDRIILITRRTIIEMYASMSCGYSREQRDIN